MRRRHRTPIRPAVLLMTLMLMRRCGSMPGWGAEPVQRWNVQAHRDDTLDACPSTDLDASIGQDRVIGDILQDITAIWDREGFGPDEAVSEPLYTRLCAAIRVLQRRTKEDGQ